MLSTYSYWQNTFPSFSTRFKEYFRYPRVLRSWTPIQNFKDSSQELGFSETVSNEEENWIYTIWWLPDWMLCNFDLWGAQPFVESITSMALETDVCFARFEPLISKCSGSRIMLTTALRLIIASGNPARLWSSSQRSLWNSFCYSIIFYSCIFRDQRIAIMVSATLRSVALSLNIAIPSVATLQQGKHRSINNYSQELIAPRDEWSVLGVV